MHRLKVWSCDRSKKFAIKFTNEGDILKNVMQKGCELLQILGTRLVAEDDGTLVADEDDVMYYTQIDKPVLLLEDGEIWFPPNLHSLKNNTESLEKQRSSMEIDLETIKEPVLAEIGNQTNDVLQAVTENKSNEIPAVDNNGRAEDANEEMPLQDEAAANQEGPIDNPIEAHLKAKRASFTSWATYVIPWTQLGPSDLEKCRTGVASAETQRSVVHAIINDMHFCAVQHTCLKI